MHVSIIHSAIVQITAPVCWVLYTSYTDQHCKGTPPKLIDQVQPPTNVQPDNCSSHGVPDLLHHVVNIVMSFLF